VINDLLMPPTITLLSDFGSADGFPAAIKAGILKRLPDATFIDITHDIAPQNVAAASFVLGQVAPRFPARTVHLAVVDPGVGSDRVPLILISPGGHKYVAPDNGLLTHVVAHSGPLKNVPHEHGFLEPYRAEVPDRWAAYEIDPGRAASELSNTFHGRDLFGPVAALLAHGAAPQGLGDRVGEITFLNVPGPSSGDDSLSGRIQYIDHFGNAATNIREADLTDIEIIVACRKFVADGPVDSYAAASGPGAIIASHGFLELFETNGSAAARYSLAVGDRVTVTSRVEA